MTEEPVPPRRERKDIPPDLESICLQCLEKLPEQRYVSARDLADDLKRFLAHQPVRARRLGPITRTWRWCLRHRTVVSLALILFLVLGVQAATTTVLWRRAVVERGRADWRAEQLAVKSEQLEQAIDRLFRTVADSPEIHTVDAEHLRQRLLSEVREYYELFLTESPQDDALRLNHSKNLFRLAEIHAALGDRQGAVRLARQALVNLNAVRLPGDDATANRARWQAFLGHHLFRAGQFDEARQVYQDLLADEAVKADQDAALIASAWSDLAASELFLADTTRARAAATEAQRLWKQCLAANPHLGTSQNRLAYARWLVTQGQLCEMTGAPTESKSYFEQAIEWLSATPWESDDLRGDQWRAMLARSQQGLGIAFAELGELSRARQWYQASLTEYGRLVRQRPSAVKYREDMTGPRYSLAVTELLLENYAQAEQLIRENVAEMRSLQQAAPDQRLTLEDRCGKDLNLLYVILRRKGDTGGANEAIEEALACFQTVLEERPDWTETRIAQAETVGNFGNLLADMKRDSEAIEQYERSRSLIEPIHQLQPQHARAARVFHSSFTGPIALYSARQQFDLALTELQRMKEALPGLPARERWLEVWLLDRSGNYDKAASVLEELVASTGWTPEDAAQIAEQARNLVADHENQNRRASETGSPPPDSYLARLHELAAEQAPPTSP